MSWTRINHPSEVVKPGQKIQVKILKLNQDGERVSLGLRQILPDPWEEVRHKYHQGDIIRGNVSRLVPFGAFVQVEGGIEGIIPNSELAARKVSNPEDVVSVGQSVEVKVIDVRPDERRMTLSIKQLQADLEKEREEVEYKTFSNTAPDTRTTIGDLIGEQLGDLAANFPEKQRSSKKAKAKSRREKIDDEDDFAEEKEIEMDEPIVDKVEFGVGENVIDSQPEVEAVVEEVVEEPVAVEAVAENEQESSLEETTYEEESEIQVEGEEEIKEEMVIVIEARSFLEWSGSLALWSL